MAAIKTINDHQHGASTTIGSCRINEPRSNTKNAVSYNTASDANTNVCLRNRASQFFWRWRHLTLSLIPDGASTITRYLVWLADVGRLLTKHLHALLAARPRLIPRMSLNSRTMKRLQFMFHQITSPDPYYSRMQLPDGIANRNSVPSF